MAASAAFEQQVARRDLTCYAEEICASAIKVVNYFEDGQTYSVTLDLAHGRVEHSLTGL